MLTTRGRLAAIPVDADRVVIKCGLREVVVTFDGAEELVATVLPLLDGTRRHDEVVAAVPGPRRDHVELLLAELRRRSMLLDGPAPERAADEDDADALTAAFYAALVAPDAARALQQASVTMIGQNLVTRAAARSLLECGLGHLVLVTDRLLDDDLVPVRWASEKALDVVVPDVHDRVAVRDELRDPDVDDAAVLVAASDFGLASRLLELNRAAIAAGTRYLPAWVDQLVGRVGPLVHPGETACLRCYTVRREANDPRRDVTRRVDGFLADEPAGRGFVGLLPPVADAVGALVAIEVVKAVTGMAPPDTAGRALDVNLVSYRGHSRRVLKVPRCPDCSEVVRVGPRVHTTGPQIPYKEV